MSIDIDTPEGAASAPSAAETAVPSPPRTRWAAVIWGAVFAAIATIAIALLADGTRSAEIADGILSLSPATMTAIVLLALGGIVLICGAIGLIRRLQRRSSAMKAV